jgi:glycosyltransferase involved in cell wall biosynthesis
MSEIETQFPNKEGLLNIYFHVSENSGVGYYRQFLPAIKMREQGLANVMISDFRWGIGDHVEPDIPTLIKIMDWADIVVTGRKDQGEFYAQWGKMKEIFNVPIVMDTDDNVMHVRPSNPGYQGYFPGSDAIMWNKYGVSKVFDAITVSTEDLIKVYGKYNKKVFLLPNNLDVEWWDKFPKKQFDDGIVRIGFICSASHPEGVKIIKAPIVKILKQYPNTRFLISKIFHNEFSDTDVFDRIEAVPWINLEEWPEKYKELGIDIGLAPLTDNMFNRAKSNLRWMEYSLQGVPSVVSPVEAYSCVRDGKDGLIAKEQDEWFNAIEKLVVDKEYREKMGKTALHRIETEYNIDRNIRLWVDTYKDIHDKFHSFFGRKKKFAIGKKGLQEMKGWK